MGHAKTKWERIMLIWRLYLEHPEGISDQELAEQLGVDYASAFRYRKELDARKVAYGRWTAEPTPDDVALARAILDRAGITHD